MPFYDQAEFDIRFEWGLNGVEALAPISDAIVIVDVLSFSTAIEIATNSGAFVFPYKWRDQSAQAYAHSIGAELADPTRKKGNWSLSPSSLIAIQSKTKLILPSPNGSTLSLSTGKTATIAACLRNAKAVAEFCGNLGKRISVIAAGEKWKDDALRPALEDQLGAGAVISFLKGALSPEAEGAKQLFLSCQENLQGIIRRCSSGRELIERGFESDIEYASEFNVSRNIPILKDGFYSSANFSESQKEQRQ